MKSELKVFCECCDHYIINNDIDFEDLSETPKLSVGRWIIIDLYNDDDPERLLFCSPECLVKYFYGDEVI
jgi:hypothetical protein